MEIVKYGVAIKGTNEPLGFYTSKGGDDFCTDVEYQFEEYANNVWLVDRLESAEKAANAKPKWYNADYSTPMHIDGKELEVIKITLNVEKV